MKTIQTVKNTELKIIEHPYGLGSDLVKEYINNGYKLINVKSIHLDSEDKLFIFNDMISHCTGKFILDTGMISNMVYDIVLNGLEFKHVQYNIDFLKQLSKIVDLEIILVNNTTSYGGYSDHSIDLTEDQYQHIIELFDYIFDKIDLPKKRFYKEQQ